MGDTAQSVRDPDASNCRYQEPPAPWPQKSDVPPYTIYSELHINNFIY